MIDLTKILISSQSSALKLWKEGSGVGTVPARTGADFQYDQITIPHLYGSDELLFQVGIYTVAGDVYYTPLFANGGFYAISYIDATNLYIEVGDASTVDELSIPFQFTYRILIP